MNSNSRLRVLLTGPGGRIGPHLLPACKSRYDLRLFDRQPIDGESVIVADLSDRDALWAAMEGIDVVVHLAATSDEAPFVEELVPNNIVGLYHVYEAAREAGVRRVVFASTVQAVGFHSREHTVRSDEPHRPVTMYGVTKAFGEVVGRFYHDRYGIEVVNVRIGAFQPYESPYLRKAGSFARRIWLSPGDAVQILTRAIETPGVGFATVHATSKNEIEFLGLSEAREILGYEPADDVVDIPIEEGDAA